MANDDVTQLSHYTNFPLCGYCMNAWDILFGRMRTIISCEKWLSFCKYGGCDPAIWDFIDDRTGWPYGMKINPANGWPRCFTDLSIPLPIPEYDNRVFHMRSDDGDRAPWRKTSTRLREEALKRKAKIKGIKLEDVEWDEEEPPITTEPIEVDLEDQDIW